MAGWTPIERLDTLVVGRELQAMIGVTRLVSPVGFEATLVKVRGTGATRGLAPIVSAPALERDFGLDPTACVVDVGLRWSDADGTPVVTIPTWGVHVTLQSGGWRLPGLRRDRCRSIHRVRVIDIADRAGAAASDDRRPKLSGDHLGCLTQWALPVIDALPLAPASATRLSPGTAPLCRDVCDEPIAV